MRHALAIVLLLTAVLGAVARPRRLPAWVFPATAALVSLAVGTVSVHLARTTLRPLVAPLVFVALAVPLATMLDEVGIFEELASWAARRRFVVGACWVIAAAVVALLNLDAAVVLLTPLYARTARRVGLDPVVLVFQPVLLAMLASGVLPVSNLTNLIAAARLSLTTTDFLTHLALPSVVASAVGWVAYRLVFRQRASIAPARGEVDRRALGVGAAAIALFLVVLVGGERAGVAAWVAALVAIVFLVPFTRRVPWERVPVGTLVLAAALAVVAAGAAAAFPHALASAGRGGLRGFTTGVVAGNLLNNLPAALVTVNHVGARSVWPLLFGLNAGPSLVLTGSLAALLWQASARASGVELSAPEFSRVGVLVGVPAMVAGFVVLRLL